MNGSNTTGKSKIRKELPFPAKPFKILLEWIYCDEMPADLSKVRQFCQFGYVISCLFVLSASSCFLFLSSLALKGPFESAQKRAL